VQDRIAAARRGWPARRTDVAAELKAWFEPLLEYAEQHHDEEDIQLGDWMIQRRCPT
jgi:hypothetical protein